MQFVVTAYDFTDEGALDRRKEARPDHLANLQKVREYGSVVCAGGMTNEAGLPKGSVLIMDFASRELLDKYLEEEPYIQRDVWESVTVEPLNVVIVNDEMVGK